HAYGGMETEIIWVGQTPAVTGAKVLILETNPTTNVVNLQGQTIGGAYDQTLGLNPFGDVVRLAKSGTVSESGNLVMAGDVHAATLGTDGIATIVGELRAYGGIDTPIIYVGQTNAPGSKVVFIGTNPTTNVVNIQGETIGGAYDQTLGLNPFG